MSDSDSPSNTPVMEAGFIRSPEGLVQAGLTDLERVTALEAVTARYAMAISPALAGLIDPADPADPVALQFIPDERELESRPEELADPIGDLAHQPVPGIVHRYPDRVLLKAVNICPVYCRFCFRRETVGPGADQVLSESQLDAAMAYIASDKAIWEVILTGGDPLALSPRRMTSLMQRLADIQHVKIVRLHTRVPVVDSQRVTGALVDALKASGKTVFVALHANHPREMSTAARQACARIIDAGIPMLSQSVLLKGVNDDEAVLADLMRCFVENRIKPYYLHHPDLAPGTSHFRLSLEKGRALMRRLRGRLSGLAQPEYVIDIPGGFGKSPAASQYVSLDAKHEAAVQYAIEDWQGMVHQYEEMHEHDVRAVEPAKG